MFNGSMSDDEKRRNREERLRRKRETLEQQVTDWLDDMVDPDQAFSDQQNYDEYLEMLRSDEMTPEQRRSLKGIDRYSAWQDFYGMYHLPSGRWEATCYKCGETFVRPEQKSATGKVYKTSAERTMDAVEAHIMRDCQTISQREGLPNASDLPLEPPF